MACHEGDYPNTIKADRLKITLKSADDKARLMMSGGICIILEIGSLLSKNYQGYRCACVMDNIIS